jgi:O-antigen ligase
MSREKLDTFCERAILALVLGILVFGPLAFGAVDVLPFLVVQAATGLVLLLWVARIWISDSFKFLWPPICWAVLAFAAYAVVRYLTADIEYVARQELLRMLTYAFLLLAIVNNLHRKEPVQIISFSLIVLAMAISGYAFYQFVANSQKVWNVVNGYSHRGTGTYINPNHLAGFVEMILPVAAAYALAGRVKPVTRILLGYASLVMAAGIAVTLSRGGWVAASVSSLVLLGILTTQRAYRLPAGVFLVLVVAGCLVLIPKSHIFEKRAKVVYDGRIDDDARFIIWAPAVKLWRENLWWGVGPGHFDERFRPVRPPSLQLQPERVHNDFLNTVVDWGIAGAALIGAGLSLLAIGVIRSWGHVRREYNELGGNKHSNKFAFLVGASCGLVAISVHSLVDFNMHIPANAILAITWAALLTSHLRFTTDRWWHNSRLWARAAVTVLLASGVIYFGREAWRAGTEWVWLERADKVPLDSPEQVRLLKEAFRVEPKNFETAFRLGESYRRLSKVGAQEYPEFGGVNYEALARTSMEWYQRAMNLNRWKGYAWLGYGLCLDWLDQTAESPAYFDRAEELDPNGYFMIGSIGMHYWQVGDLAAARSWFERSLRLQRNNNDAVNSLALINATLLQAATNEVKMQAARPDGTKTE